MSVHPLIESLKGKLVVSVQAYPGEPLRTPEHMAAMSRACELGGAAAIRCQGLSDIAAIKGRVEIPVIGLWKDGHEGVYITPTLRHARAGGRSRRWRRCRRRRRRRRGRGAASG